MPSMPFSLISRAFCFVLLLLLLFSVVMVAVLGDNVTFDCYWWTHHHPLILCSIAGSDSDSKSENQLTQYYQTITNAWLHTVEILFGGLNLDDAKKAPQISGFGIFLMLLVFGLLIIIVMLTNMCPCNHTKSQ